MLLHLLRGHPYFYCADASTFATFTARTSYFYCANTPTFTARTLSPTCTVRLCVRTLLLLLRGRSYLRYLYNCTVQTLLLLLCAAVFTISRYQSGINTFLIEIGLVWESGMKKVVLPYFDCSCHAHFERSNTKLLLCSTWSPPGSRAVAWRCLGQSSSRGLGQEPQRGAGQSPVTRFSQN